MSKTVAQQLVAGLESLGVRIAFGLPGVHNLALWDALRQSQIRLVGVRHEQTAVYAADGHARVTGELGVAITTTGPGAANGVAACGEAWSLGSPVLVIATDIPAGLRRPGVHRGVLHETRDQARMFETVVKSTFVVDDPSTAAQTLHLAAAAALSAPTGPCYLEVPTDFFGIETDETATMAPMAIAPAPRAEEVARGAALLANAERPLLWVGRGAIAAGEQVELVAGLLGAPVIETFGARGVVSPSFPGWTGFAPHFPEIGELWDEADAVLAVGTDFDGSMTQNWALPVPPTLVSINLVEEEANKAYQPDITLIGDAAETLAALATALPERQRENGHMPGLFERRESLRVRLESEEPAAMAFVHDLAAAVPPDTPVVPDMCVAGYWIGATRAFAKPRLMAYPIGWGTLGFGFPASIGTALSTQTPTLCVCGDGGFLFAAGELAVLAETQPPLTVLIVDDGGYGMLRFDQEHAGDVPFGVDLAVPDFVALARSFGVEAEKVADVGEPLQEALTRSLSQQAPRVLVLEKTLTPPESTSPRWYRRRLAKSGG
jgi:thiamine pyrophosphate-dependent acetolactate synthase large subunit-like protein